jgi:hypothetical protein
VHAYYYLWQVAAYLRGRRLNRESRVRRRSARDIRQTTGCRVSSRCSRRHSSGVQSVEESRHPPPFPGRSVRAGAGYELRACSRPQHRRARCLCATHGSPCRCGGGHDRGDCDTTVAPWRPNVHIVSQFIDSQRPCSSRPASPCATVGPFRAYQYIGRLVDWKGFHLG